MARALPTTLQCCRPAFFSNRCRAPSLCQPGSKARLRVDNTFLAQESPPSSARKCFSPVFRKFEDRKFTVPIALPDLVRPMQSCCGKFPLFEVDGLQARERLRAKSNFVLPPPNQSTLLSLPILLSSIPWSPLVFIFVPSPILYQSIQDELRRQGQGCRCFGPRCQDPQDPHHPHLPQRQEP